MVAIFMILATSVLMLSPGTGMFGPMEVSAEGEKKSISSAVVTFGSKEYPYTGEERCPVPTVKIEDEDDGLTTLKENVDYKISSYSNNEEVGTASVKIKGIGDYTGTVTGTFSIVKASLKNASVSISPTGYTYTGNRIEPDKLAENDPTNYSFDVRLDGTPLSRETDYYVEYYSNVNAGTATAVVTGKGNYTDSTQQTFTIEGKSITKTTITLSGTSFEYTGSEITPSVTVKDGDDYLVKGTNYALTYTDNVSAGVGKVIITGLNEYSGTTTRGFEIKAKASDSSGDSSGDSSTTPGTTPSTDTDTSKTVTISSVSLAGGNASLPYTGGVQQPAIIVKDTSENTVSSAGYTTSYTNNVNIGSATVTVNAKGVVGGVTYIGSADTTFNITACTLSDSNVTLSDTAYIYDGTAKTPTVTVKVGDRPLVQGTDYTYVYNNNISVGTGSVTVTGKGNYTGTATQTFTIIDENNASVKKLESMTLSFTTATYTGSSIMPTVTVKDVNGNIVPTAGYSVEYKNNINVTTENSLATVTVKGKGSLVSGYYYSGTLTSAFTITRASLSGATISLSQSAYTYDGTQKMPTVTVSKNSRTLTRDTDYTLEYSNNINVGTATVTITGIGNYTGTATKQFTINAASSSDDESNSGSTTEENLYKVSSVALSYKVVTYSGGSKTPTVTARNTSGAKISETYYDVYYDDNINVGTATVSIRFTGLYADNGTYTRAFTIRPKGTELKSNLKRYSSYKKVRIYIKKQKTQTTGYQIKYSKKIGMGSAKTISVKKSSSSVLLTNLSKDACYYLKVRTYKTIDGERIYSAWSGKYHFDN